MTKIKKFNIVILPIKIFKILKLKNLLTAKDFEEEELVNVFGIKDIKLVKKEKREKIEEVINFAQGLIVPCVLYKTLNKEKTRELFSGMDNLVKRIKDWLAVSLWVVTIGEQLEDEIRKKEASGDLFLSQVLEVIGNESLREASCFVNRLVASEARKQECELIFGLDNYSKEWNGEISKKVLTIIEVEKIGITFNENYQLLPKKSMLAIVGWVSTCKPR
jgi:hypothetical protein